MGSFFSNIGGLATGSNPGGIGGLLGPNGAGLTGTTSEGTQQTIIDPDTKRLNELRLQQLTRLFQGQAYDNADNPLGALTHFANISPDTSNLVNAAVGFSSQGLQPQDWYNQSRNDLYPGSQQQSLQNLSTSNTDYINGLSTNAFNNVSTIGNNNLDYINNDLAPRLLGSGQDYFRQILSPQIQNQSALLGLARSGYNEEAQAKGAASISLPISQLIAQLGAGQNQQTQALESGLRGQNLGLNEQNALTNLQGQQGFNTQYLQNLYGLNQQQPNVDIALQNAYLGRLGQQLQASDYPRQVGQSAYSNIGNLYLSALNATPYQPATRINTTGTGNTGVLTSLLGGGASQGAGNAVGTALLA